ncbi:hypothetical protein J5J86_17480 [Aquabacter sp. L1I39]|uniref:hypothetical protein n=1 Tax=Aquabacter sp. L1I39 TaxID=2820278 RepID=UPI001ADD41CE|nr:hypothetical protein [Aquabacter sp. L1I39]QTL02565.1 hypothetical protein J5J86_17480 [Aquabacter sp. L1I39]
MSHQHAIRPSRAFSTGRAVALVLTLGLAVTLGGCAGDGGPFAWFGKDPDVPKAAPTNQFPGFADKPVQRPPVLDAGGQAAMETELETLAKQTRQRGDEATKEDVQQ